MRPSHLHRVPEPPGGTAIEEWLITLEDGSRRVLFVMEEGGEFRCETFISHNEGDEWIDYPTECENIEEARGTAMLVLFSDNDVTSVERILDRFKG